MLSSSGRGSARSISVWLFEIQLKFVRFGLLKPHGTNYLMKHCCLYKYYSSYVGPISFEPGVSVGKGEGVIGVAGPTGLYDRKKTASWLYYSFGVLLSDLKRAMMEKRAPTLNHPRGQHNSRGLLAAIMITRLFM